MKNKLFVRGAVIVVALMLLVSTVAFADATATPEFDAEQCAIVFDGGYTSSEDQVTLLAFAVEKGTEASAVAALADGTGVVAINQVAGSVGFTTVKINPDLFEEVVTEDKDIAVLVGGSDGNVKPFVLSVDEEVVEPTTYTVAYELNGGALAEGVENATSFTDDRAAAFIAALVAPTKADLVEDTETATSTTTYTFAGWYLDAEFATEATAENLVAGTSTTVTLYAKWTSNTTTVDKPVATKVTVMNGTTPIELTADASGNVTLPATATFDKTMVSEDYNMSLYSWVTADEATEHLAGATVVAADLEGVTLYAKYVCDKTYGDVNGDGDINSSDYGDVLRVATGKSARRLTGKPLFEGSTIKLGDVLVDGDINSSDYGDILRVATGKSARRQTGKPIYYIYYVQNN